MVAVNGHVDRHSPEMVSFILAGNNESKMAGVAWQAGELLAEYLAKAVCNHCFANRA